MLIRIFKNTIALLTASLIEKIAYVMFFAVIARKLTQAEFGAYNLIFALIYFSAILANFGMENVIIREVAKNREQANSLFNNVWKTSLIFSLGAWLFAPSLATLFHYDKHVVYLLSSCGVIFIFMGFSQVAAAIVKAYERMEIIALVGSFHSLLGLGLGVVVLLMGGTITGLVIVLLVTEGLKAAVMTSLVHRYFTPLTWSYDISVITLTIKQAIPFALLITYGILLRRIDLLMMGWLRPLEEVAIYSVAAKFTDFFALLSGSMIGALFPAFSATLSSSKKESWKMYNDSIAVFAILGFGAAFSIFALAKPLITLVFGETYLGGAFALCLLGLGFLFSMLSGPVGVLLVAVGERLYRLVFLGIVVLVCNIALNLYLIPLYSYNGAALATLLSSILGFLTRLLLSRIHFGQLPNLITITWRSLLAGSLMCCALIMFNGLQIIILIALGGLVYCITLFLLGEFREQRYGAIRIKLSSLFGIT